MTRRLAFLAAAALISSLIMPAANARQPDGDPAARAAVAGEIGERWRRELGKFLADSGPAATEAFYETAALLPKSDLRPFVYDVLRAPPENRDYIVRNLIERDPPGRLELVKDLRSDALEYGVEPPKWEDEARPLVAAELEVGQQDALDAALRAAGPQAVEDFYDLGGRMPVGDRGNFADFVMGLPTATRAGLFTYFAGLTEFDRLVLVSGMKDVPVQSWVLMQYLVDGDRADLIRPLFAGGRAVDCALDYWHPDMAHEIGGANQTVFARGDPLPGDLVAICPPRRVRGIRMDKVSLYQAPWQAQIYRAGNSALSYYTGGDAKKDRRIFGKALEPFENRHVCGGSYIGDGFVLTAAHCIGASWKSRQPAFFDGRRIRMGTANIDEPGQNFAIASVVVHKQFTSTKEGNDIALIRLADVPGDRQLAAAGVHVVLLPPPNRNWRPRQNLEASGWGYTGETDDTGNPRDRYGQLQHVSQWLRMGELVAYPASKCEEDDAFREKYGKNFKLRNGQVCAGSTNGVDTCRGDSGGPLVDRRPGDSTLLGIVSYGLGCGRADRPAVYTDVAYFRKWIDRAKLKATSKEIVYLR